MLFSKFSKKHAKIDFNENYTQVEKKIRALSNQKMVAEKLAEYAKYLREVDIDKSIYFMKESNKIVFSFSKIKWISFRLFECEKYQESYELLTCIPDTLLVSESEKNKAKKIMDSKNIVPSNKKIIYGFNKSNQKILKEELELVTKEFNYLKNNPKYKKLNKESIGYLVLTKNPYMFKEYHSAIYHDSVINVLKRNDNIYVDPPKFSVIIPIFNVEDYLRECLDSVLIQNVKNIEIICVNDGSSDSSLDILKYYANIDKRVKIINIENAGAGNARNVGMNVAKGEFVFFLDGDDFIDLDLFSVVENSLKKYNPDICIFKRRDLEQNTFLINEVSDSLNVNILKKNKIKCPFSAKQVPNSILQIANIGVYTKVYKRTFLKKINVKFLNTKRCNDVYFNHITLLLASKISVVDQELMTYRIFRQNSLTSQRGDTLEYLFESYSKLLSILDNNNVKDLYLETVYQRLYKAFKYELSLATERGLKNEFEKSFDAFRMKYFSCYALEDHSVRKYQYKTFSNLVDLLRKKAHLYKNFDLLVGIPRSGIFPAYVLALFLNKRCCTLNEFINGLHTNKVGLRHIDETTIKNVLIIDDSINTGNGLEKAKSLIPKELCSLYTIKYLAVYSLPHSSHLVDYYLEYVSSPRIFQWNYLNHPKSKQWCFDIDGVLCVDPTEDENDDGEKYRNFILNAQPLYIPTYTINTIVTSRLEKYRKETEVWLNANNVKYTNLVMLRLDSAEERRRLGCHASFKAEVYKSKLDCDLFVESDDNQAKEIAKLSGKQCICVSSDKIY